MSYQMFSRELITIENTGTCTCLESRLILEDKTFDVFQMFLH